MLTPKQIEELNIASARKASGKASREDFLNIEYAKNKFGYEYKPEPPVEPPKTPPPAVVSSETARTQAAKDTQKLADISKPVEETPKVERPEPEPVQVGKYVFETDDGRSIYGTVNQYGDFVPDKAPQAGSPEDIALKADKGTVRQISEAESTVSSMLTASERRLNNYLDEIERLGTRVDDNLKSTLASITQSYERRRQEQRRLNQAILGGSAKIESRMGRDRYAQQISQDILTDKEQKGLDQLALIDQQEQLAVQAAQDAADEKKFALLNKQLEAVEKLRAEKNKLIFDLQAEARENEKLVMEKVRFAREENEVVQKQIDDYIKSTQEGAIMGLIAQGITDPVTIYEYLNTDEEGKPREGVNIGLEQITTLLKSIKDSKANPEKFKTVGGPKEGFYQLELDEDGQIVNVTPIIAPEAEKLSVSEVKTLRELGYDVTLGMTREEASLLGAPVSEQKTEQQIEAETALRKEFQSQPEVKQYIDLKRSYNSLESAYEEAKKKNASVGSKAAADQALVTLFNKMLDPTSVVREGEYARSFQGQSALARAAGYVEQITQGGAGLTDENRKDMVDIADRLLKDAKESYKQAANFYKEIAEDSNLDADFVIRSLEEEVKVPTTPVKQMSYPTLESFLVVNPDYRDFAVQLQENEGLSNQEVVDFLTGSFSGAGGGTATITPNNYVVTGYGSDYWDKGLDISIGGGGAVAKGKPVSLPVAGEVIEIKRGYSNPQAKPLTKEQGKKQNSGFGNQVKIRTQDGQEIWLSHLDSVANLRVGQKIARGQTIGTQGNTGMTYGSTGVHVDVTMKDKNGRYLEAQQVKQYLDRFA